MRDSDATATLWWYDTIKGGKRVARITGDFFWELSLLLSDWKQADPDNRGYALYNTRDHFHA